VAAFYEPLGDGRFLSTPATSGPWDPRSQHGGPPAALLGRAFEHLEPARPELRLARVTVEILGPVPVAEVVVRARVARPGRRVELLEGVLEVEGREAMRAVGWRIAVAAGRAPVVPEPGEPLPLPKEKAPVDWGGEKGWRGAYTGGYLSAIEWLFCAGAPGIPGPAQAWLRPRIPLVAGEEISPFSRTLLLADSGSGVSAELTPDDWLFVNTDLTVVLYRVPAGEWTCLESRTTIGADGVGMAETRLADERGRMGRALQTLLVAPRS
jgi:Thioesterase-like superfamily